MARRYLIRHPRSAFARWARRIIGVAATAVVLAVGVMIVGMLASIDDDESATHFPAAIPTVQAGNKHHHRPRTHERPASRPGT